MQTFAPSTQPPSTQGQAPLTNAVGTSDGWAPDARYARIRLPSASRIHRFQAVSTSLRCIPSWANVLHCFCSGALSAIGALDPTGRPDRRVDLGHLNLRVPSRQWVKKTTKRARNGPPFVWSGVLSSFVLPRAGADMKYMM